MFPSFIHFCKDLCLDTLFPKSRRERAIEALTPEKLAERLILKEENGIVSLFSYQDPLIQEMIWMLKYKKNKQVALLFATLLNDYLIEEIADGETFGEQLCITPLPLSKKRERERGFNQITLVTDALHTLGDYRVVHPLKRTKHTPPQTSLKRRAERHDNIKGVFVARSTEDIRNVHIVILDDVATTGSTLKEAKRALREAGIKHVSCLALAH